MNAFYEKMRLQQNPDFNFDTEDEVNMAGYTLLGKRRDDDAIAVFTYNTQRYPNSSNVWDSLAEAQAKAGKLKKAQDNYKKALALDPSNTNAKNMIIELERQLSALRSR